MADGFLRFASAVNAQTAVSAVAEPMGVHGL